MDGGDDDLSQQDFSQMGLGNQSAAMSIRGQERRLTWLMNKQLH
jgi:hypothetical protein